MMCELADARDWMMATMRSTAKQGQFAKLTAGAEKIEIKATVPNAQIAVSLRRYRLTRNNDQPRLIYFLDTPERSMRESGVMVRCRSTSANPLATLPMRPPIP
jgi:hypothetical protein